MRRLWVQALLLIALAVPPGLATALWHPSSPWAPGPGSTPGNSASEVVLAEGEVNLDTALAWADSVVWIDARPRKEYQAEHIPGAIHLTQAHWDEQLFTVLDALPLDGEAKVVVYCSSRQCGASKEVANRLRQEAGLEEVLVLHGGWEAWRDAKKEGRP